MNPYYVVINGYIIPRQEEKQLDIDTKLYEVVIQGKGYKVSRYTAETSYLSDPPTWIVDVKLKDSEYTIFCNHLGQLLVVLDLLSNLFPKHDQ